MENRKNKLLKQTYLTYKKAMELLNSDEYKEFIEQFEKTNKRFYFNGVEKLFLSLMEEEEAEEMFTKCYPVYDSFSEKFKIATLSKFANVEFDTFSYVDCEEIVRWLNEKLQESSIDDVVLEHILTIE